MSTHHDPIEEVIDALRKSLDRALDERDAALRSSIEVEQQRDLCRDLTLRFESELENQRRDLARRLNDEIGAHATAIRTMAQTLGHRLAEQDPSLVQLASLLLKGTDALCDSVRSMIQEVRPEALAFGGLLEGLRTLVADWRLRASRVRFELLAEPDDDALFGLGPSRIESLAYACVVDALERAVSDGRASLVLVSARRGAASVVLQVSDDGLPFRQRDSAMDEVFESLQTQVTGLGGTLTMHSGESGGVEVLLSLPWPPRDRGAGSEAPD
ncbi:MAG: hypothetical protein RIS35_2093 [Pseudomonadota bacterium]|jgi:glucose-6-phosphate-specific signal transduction histidine kinase